MICFFPIFYENNGVFRVFYPFGAEESWQKEKITFRGISILWVSHC